ncbi:LLM class flavin-dependent oxidoreductase [Gryllotalpicola reticulitermitis]|uniref:LLM class flavin-dependent oxidoreductase n=1 Tax=Gryllotalpicola reticulitermitis TaxID=1184153 RepID=A0ABV8Q8L1_9MICO
MPEPKRLIVNVFEMACVSHITHGLWRLPDNNRHRFAELSYWTELAQLAEQGGLDGIFLADVVGAYDTFRGGPETAIREGLQIPNLDPLLVIPAMATVTQHLGFGVTFSTTYEPPFAFARRMSTLDALTGGRVGWNIVTSYLSNAARNFGLEDQIPHDERYQIADEYLDVLYKLWEGSWDDDAVVNDPVAGIYSDPAKVHAINHVGKHFTVAGPHLVAPTPQRVPLLFQATGSPAGIAFAGKHSEVVFTGGRTVEDFQSNANRMRDAAESQGRERGDVKFVVQAGVIVGRTESEVADKERLFQEYSSLDGVLAHSGFPFDITAYPHDSLVSDAIADAGLPAEHPVAKRFAEGATIGQALEELRHQRHDRFYVAGTPKVVADEIEKWLDEDGIDGINLRQYHSYDTVRDFVELVVPELRRRGRIREEYTPGETLRERYFGASRLPERHPAARYRGGKNL